MQFLLGPVVAAEEHHAHIIETFERAHRRGAHGDAVPAVRKEAFHGFAADAHPFGVHAVASDAFALYGLERAGTHVQSDFRPLHAVAVEVGEYGRREVQASRGGGHAAFYLRIYGLIGREIFFLRGAVQIRGDRQFANGFEHFRESRLPVAPVESNLMARAAFAKAFCGERQRLFAHGDRLL